MDWLRDFFKRYEFRRKTVHFILGISLVVFINLRLLDNTRLVMFFLLCLICAITLSIYTKLNKPHKILKILAYFDKPRDLIKFPARGAIYYFIGVITVLLFFDLRTTSAAILILAFGDPAAHIVGRYYGKTRLLINKKKVLEGTLAGTFLGTIAASFFVPPPIAFFGAAFGMIAEAFELEMLHLDDNFFIPFVSALTMAMIQSLI